VDVAEFTGILEEKLKKCTESIGMFEKTARTGTRKVR
jgi:hypothetical protein